MIAVLIQARLNSVRLPKKALYKLGDSTVLGQVVRRAKQSSVDKVIVVSQDDEIIDVAKREGVHYSQFQTNDRDVLAEFYHAAKTFRVDTIVRLTGDCPCVSPKGIDQLVGMFDGSRDIICNHSDEIDGLGIDGLDIEVFSFGALQRAHMEAHSDYDVEHVCPWMYRNLKHEQIACMWDFNPKLSIDTRDDYNLVYDIFNELGNDFETRELMEFFKDRGNEEN